MRFAPHRSIESAEHAARELRGAIVAGRLRPGDRLTEASLAEQLRVSRHPVREALRTLSREGLVNIRPNRGAVVASLDPRDVLEVYAIRASLGSLALRQLLASGPPEPARLARLEQLARKTLSYAARGQQPPMVAHDLAFQAEIVAASGLPRAAVYFGGLGAEIQRFINVLAIDFPDKEATARREVWGLFEAIRDGDHARADTIWQAKFTVAAGNLVALLPASGPSAGRVDGQVA